MASKHKSTSQQRQSETKRSSGLDALSIARKNWISIGILFLLVVILFWDIIFNGKIFSDTADAAAFQSWAKATQHIHETEHTDEVLWIPYIFSGMPVYASLLLPKIVNYFEYYLILKPIEILFSNAEQVRDVVHLFLCGVCMFALARNLKFSPLASFLAAITLMLNPYAVGALQAGQGSKIVVLSFIPILFLLVYQLLHEKKLGQIGLLGLIGMTCAVVGTSLLSLHPQMEFYAFMMIGCYLLYESILNIKKEPGVVLRNVVLIVIAIMIGFAISAYTYLPAQEYARYSIRGGGVAGMQGGLDYDYATNWSFHPFEMMNYIIPSFFGFSTPFYWGWMPFTESTVYVGIVPLLLAIIALIYRRTRLTWFLAGFSVVMLLISFGKHFGILYNLMFYYFPYFNKFRVPALILHLMPITIGILAAQGFMVLSDMNERAKDFDLVKMKKRLTIALIVIGALLVLGFIANDTIYSSLSSFMFQKSDDLQQLRQQYGAQAQQVLGQLKRLRFDLLWKDYVKFAFIGGASIGLLIIFVQRKIKTQTLGVGLVVILLIDLIILDTKFIEPKPKASIVEHFQPDATTQFLLRDTSLYRIYPIGGTFQDNTWMYHLISSVGGYSPAKLKIYQEMIDSVGLNPPKLPLNMNVLSMLNAKYIIVPGRLPGDSTLRIVNVDQEKQLVTYQNPAVLPRAFFVEGTVIARSKSEVFAQLNSPVWNPAKTAVLEKEPSVKPTKSDSTAIRNLKHTAHVITMETYSTQASLLILSEAYYPAGWKAYVDDTETEIYKTNYVLRSIIVPGGKHSVEFRFGPTPTYYLGYTLTQGAWVVTVLLMIVGIIQVPSVRNRLRMRSGEVVTGKDNS
ncbi:MAG: YfhO family protein [Ignavibacteria bacterium]|nr:YfhO family protein [Ignavibacteria bacterium]MBI3765055.1 YfhO family protein [Ignavibacteriales bacterium]